MTGSNFLIATIAVEDAARRRRGGSMDEITAGAYHASFRHQDLWGQAPAEFGEFVARFPAEFGEFVARFPAARDYAERMRLMDRVRHAIHVTGGVAARNLLEGRPRRVLAVLDALAGSSDLARIDVDVGNEAPHE